MTKQDAIAVAAKYFPNYPDVSTFHVTEDGQVFEELTHAQNHANFLQKKSKSKGDPIVVIVTKEDAADAIKGVVNPSLIPLQEAVDNAKADVTAKRNVFDNATKDKKKDALNDLEASEEALTEAENAYAEALKKA